MSAEFIGGDGDQDYPSVVDYVSNLLDQGQDPEGAAGVIRVARGLGQLTAKTAKSLLKKLGPVETDDDLED